MKGPDQRIKLDVRREWECPQCQTRRRAPGDIVSLRCTCQPDGVQMCLVEQAGTPRVIRVLNEFQAEAETDEVGDG